MRNNSLFQIISFILMIVIMYRLRYLLLNVVLRFTPIRRIAVSTFMNIPFLRGLFMKQAFKY